MTAESGSGPDVVQATRRAGYDLLGRRTVTGHPRTDIVSTNDDPGLLVATRGGGGDSAFGYDADGRMTPHRRRRHRHLRLHPPNEPRTATDTLSGQTHTWSFDAAGQTQHIETSAGTSRAYTYDQLGRLTLDEPPAHHSPTTALCRR